MRDAIPLKAAEQGRLASWAVPDRAGDAGRRHPEPPPAFRTEFQRDRDRIVHSTAFRRLVYKTQVFVNHEGDLYRTRLTHSLEVAQIARTVAAALGLNVSLVEAISLAHDLGHTPFGHAGQHALNRCMRPFGGFEHNVQSLRVVDLLEEKYADFPGLNLAFATREGILKRCPPRLARDLGELGQRFLAGTQPSLEAQLANVADELAYNNHDVDDGLRAGLLDVEALREVALFRDHYDGVRQQWQSLSGRRVIHETVRRMIGELVNDLIEASARRILETAPASVEAVRQMEKALIGFSPPVARRHMALKRYLRRHLYRHHRVHRMATKARATVSRLFELFIDDPRLLPPDPWQRFQASQGQDHQARVVADYIAGMTDRFAIAEHARLTDPATMN
ncbi:deoxyguanosinetriphosphate triphosphohydrolase [Gammaproteobacteria bacterium AB-CW1]|uniref:Deoxyguanosinetriphosphate triphosphohydrolase-like protein n=1 Tax=Natronospira elongata TaxID=3110268 RepID=A0AAP6JGL8_9GAMM|nr:deoxyguanosinetriphosphate triphosphohydrolase [Gammaproteobacteria bacterium AB-CW1]